MTQDPVTGESKATVAARLTRGHSFGVNIETWHKYSLKSSVPIGLNPFIAKRRQQNLHLHNLT